MTVRLIEFYVYEFLDAYYLVRVQTLFSAKISKDEYRLLTKFVGLESADVTVEEKSILEKLRLIEYISEPLPPKQQMEDMRRAHIVAMRQPFFAVELMISQVCNMHCTYCFGGDGEFGCAGSMDEATALRAIDRMYEIYERSGFTTAPYIMFLGGEPLINFSIIRRCVEYCTELFGPNVVKYSVSTNGVLAEPEVTDWLEENGVDVSYSFDGPYQNENRPLSGGADSYSMITNRINDAVSRFGHATCLGVFLPNQDPDAMTEEYLEIENLSYQITAAVGSPVTGSHDAGCRSEYSRIASELPSRVETAVKAVIKRDKESLRRLMRDSYFESFLMHAFFSPEYPLRRNHCDAERGRICVDVNGTLYPCHSFIGIDEYKLGTLDEDIHSGAFEESLTTVRSICADCYMRYGCAGGCRAAFSMLPEAAETANPLLYIPDEYCSYQKQKLACHNYIYWSLSGSDRAWIRTVLKDS